MFPIVITLNSGILREDHLRDPIQILPATPTLDPAQSEADFDNEVEIDGPLDVDDPQNGTSTSRTSILNIDLNKIFLIDLYCLRKQFSDMEISFLLSSIFQHFIQITKYTFLMYQNIKSHYKFIMHIKKFQYFKFLYALYRKHTKVLV